MPRKIDDFGTFDFSGGLVTNKSDYQLKENEFPRLINFDIDDKGRLVRRKGYAATSVSLSNIIYGVSFIDSTGSEPVFVIFDKGSSSNMYKLRSTTLTLPLSTTSSTASVVDTTNFDAATNFFTIDGDRITYTNIDDGTTFTVNTSTIDEKHENGAVLTQWEDVVATGIDSRAGIYAASLNGRVYITGRNASANITDGASAPLVGGSSGSDSDAPAGLFATTYKNRVYVAGSGHADGPGTRNGSPLRVSFSDLGDTATWGDYNVNWFDVEGTQRQSITGLKTYADNLMIFKLDSTYKYNLNTLKKVPGDFGAYNHFCVQEIDQLLYTFGPSGVYVSDGSSAKRISQPVENFLDNFTPKYDLQYERVIENCFTAKFDKKLYIFLQDVYLPDNNRRTETFDNMALVYDPENQSWQTYVYPDSSTFDAVFTLDGFHWGEIFQAKEGVFASDGDFIYRFFESDAAGGSAGTTPRGSDFYSDRILNDTSVQISSEIETKWYELGLPNKWKNFGIFRMLIERGVFSVSYKLDKGDKTTDWISLGEYRGTNTYKYLKDNEGYRIKFKITTTGKEVSPILNGFIIEDITLKHK